MAKTTDENKPRGPIVRKELPCVLSDDEWRQACENMGAAQGELHEFHAEHKRVLADRRGRKADLAGQLAAFGDAVRTRRVKRHVDCELRALDSRIITVRLDTDAEIDSRAMNSEEKAKAAQGKLDLSPIPSGDAPTRKPGGKGSSGGLTSV